MKFTRRKIETKGTEYINLYEYGEFVGAFFTKGEARDKVKELAEVGKKSIIWAENGFFRVFILNN